jgi:rubrerythrin
VAHPSDPRASLIRVLQSACSGELAAIHAYRGHWRSVSSPVVRTRIQDIEREEAHHRTLVLGLLGELGSGPSPLREAVFWVIGKSIGLACRIGGWFIPMYGAGRLEKSNIREYEDAARFAGQAGLPAMIDCLLTMAEVEWEHERFFRELIEGHALLRVFPLWPVPSPKAAIREPYAGESQSCMARCSETLPAIQSATPTTISAAESQASGPPSRIASSKPVSAGECRIE